jgi:hypothetical protein
MKRKRLSKKASKARKSVGRPLDLTKELINRFCGLAKDGLPLDGICDYLGVSPASFANWKRRGDAFLLNEGEPKEDEIFGLFIEKLKRALAEYRLKHVTGLNERDWKRHLAILERRDRKTFGRYEPPGGGDEDFDPDERFL